MINSYRESDILLIALIPGDPIFSAITKIQKQLSQKQLISASHAIPPIIPLSYVISVDLELSIEIVSSHSWRPLMTGSFHRVKSFLFANVQPSDLWYQFKLQIKENIKSAALGPIPLVNSLLVSTDANYKLTNFQLHDSETNNSLTNLGTRKWTAIAAKIFHKTCSNTESWAWEIVYSKRVKYQTKTKV